jgi:hypothetical protein
LFPSELNTRLAQAASAALTADAAADRWAIVLDAVAHSPVRLSVTPQSVPTEPAEELLAAVRKLAGRIPEIAGLFGVAPTTESPRSRGPRKARPAPGAKKPIPAPPARPSAPPSPPAPADEQAEPPVEPVEAVEAVEQVERLAEQSIADDAAGADVPTGDGDNTTAGENAAHPEAVEDSPEPPGVVPEGTGDEDDGGPPAPSL